MKASIALQVLPLAQGIDRIAVIDQVIAYLQTQEVTMVVTPFETVLEGEFDELMRILKEALEVAGQEADNVFANVKINVLSSRMSSKRGNSRKQRGFRGLFTMD
ncbi:thiamine-binding protein [Streptococcus pneumoniae]|uniref:thiamine-binding protein n=1 Tax=Streptococcus pneumoniae TaxID=1313 RepID=UPI0005E113FA|nr:thiamine-binding protein [Streptococcus pneumoniae]CJU12890.1 Uncharacterized conserved protein [Streptococcus pneumoniae]